MFLLFNSFLNRVATIHAVFFFYYPCYNLSTKFFNIKQTVLVFASTVCSLLIQRICFYHICVCHRDIAQQLVVKSPTYKYVVSQIAFANIINVLLHMLYFLSNNFMSQGVKVLLHDWMIKFAARFMYTHFFMKPKRSLFKNYYKLLKINLSLLLFHKI